MTRLTDAELELLERVRAFACEKFHGYWMKGKVLLPYQVHNLNVGVIVKQSGGTIEEICAAVLHDIIEDTEVTRSELEKLFDHAIAHLVSQLSDDPKTKLLSTRERKAYQALKYQFATRGARLIKMADQLDLLRSIEWNPPVGWDKEKCYEYMEGALLVCVACYKDEDLSPLFQKIQEAYYKAWLKYKPQ